MHLNDFNIKLNLDLVNMIDLKKNQDIKVLLILLYIIYTNNIFML